MNRVPLASIKRSVVFASVSETGEVAVINDFTATQRVYPSVKEFNAVRYRLVIASTRKAASIIQTDYCVFPVLAWCRLNPICFQTPSDFSFKVLQTGIATPLEETLAAKHAALRYNSVNKVAFPWRAANF